MSSFLKTVLAVLVALIIMGIINVLFTTCVFVGIIAAASGDSETAVVTQPGDVMILKINTEVTEVPSSMPFNLSMMGDLSMNSDMSLRGYLNAIDCAKADPNIAGIYLNTDGMTASPATYEALHDALIDFRASTEKWVIAYNDNFSLGQYYVASAADWVGVNTIGAVTFDGMSSTLVYPKRLLDKLGVEMQVFRVGDFKSAVEPYMIEHISDANRLQTETYLRNIWNQMAQDISASRDLPVAYLDSLADEAVSFMQPDELVKTGLVDSMLYKSDVEKLLLSMMEQEKLEGHVYTAKQLLNNYDKLFPANENDKVAVLYAVGEIASEAKGSEDEIYYENLIADIRDLTDDETVKAVVLRVNSPGGSGFASEQIWKALMDLRAAGKPLVVSMGDYAASGGYYISCMADHIVAEPNTLTGSIGVFGVIPNFSELATDKLGVNFEEVKTHKMGTLTTMRGVTPIERAKFQQGVDTFYELFTSRCAEGRDMSQDSIKAIAGGRVWTGSEAIGLGLVDELGGIDVALARAAELAGLQSYSRMNYPAPKSSMETMMELFEQSSDDLSLRIADHITGNTPADRETLRFLHQLQNADRIQARSFDAVNF